ASAEPTAAQPAQGGEALFAVHCVSCHGADGAGSDRAPDIVNAPSSQSSGTAALRDIVRNGIPGRGMPAFALPAPELDAIVAYVERMRAPAADHPVEGDVALGEAFFTGRGNCSSCHMVAGQGGVLGPDLSDIGRQRTLSQIRQALLRPEAASRAGGGSSAGSLRLDDGETIRGT